MWRNKPSIIIGKNQNAYSEIDVDYVRDHGIQVVRRLTGGGAVFHDLGNINFTFIATQKEAGADVSFERFTGRSSIFCVRSAWTPRFPDATTYR